MGKAAGQSSAGIKAKLFCVVLVTVVAVVCFISAMVCKRSYDKKIRECSAQVMGTVVGERRGSIRPNERYTPETKYTSGKTNIEIAVDDDPLFKHKKIYASINGRKKGDEIGIHYSPAEPDNYYLDDRIGDDRTIYILVFVLSGVTAAGAVLLLISTLRSRHRESDSY